MNEINQEYNNQIDRRLSGTDTMPCYTNFKSKEVTIVRLGHPVGVTELLENKNGSFVGGAVYTPKVLRRIGVPIVVRTNDNSTLEITVPATDELWDAIVETQLFMATNPMKVKFDINGIAYDIVVDKVVHDMDSPENRGYANIKWPEDQEDPDILRTQRALLKDFGSYKTLMEYVRKDSSLTADLGNVKDSATNDLMILSFDGEKKDFSIEFRDSSVSVYDAEAIRSKLSSLAKKTSIKTMDYIKDPKAIVSDIRKGMYYVKKL